MNLNLNLNLNQNPKGVFNISMKTHSSIIGCPVKQNQSFYYQLSTFMLNNSKGDIYNICQGITWYMFILGANHISRSAIAKFANCHIDTVSEANMRLEAAGIFGIFREGRKPNTYYSEFLNEIASFFGYMNKYLQSSASLLFDNIKSNLTNTIKQQVFGLKLLETPKISNKLQEKFGKMLERIEIVPPVFCTLQEAIKKEAKSLQVLMGIAKLSLNK